VAARIKELSRRITNAATRKATEQVAITKELILCELWENAQRGAQVHGGSAVTNRALELLGNHLGLFKEPEQKFPLKLEDLPPETLANMLAEAEAAAATEAEAGAAHGGVAPAPPKVN
jgi:hypothetical protein